MGPLKIFWVTGKKPRGGGGFHPPLGPNRVKGRLIIVDIAVNEYIIYASWG